MKVYDLEYDLGPGHSGRSPFMPAKTLKAAIADLKQIFPEASNIKEYVARPKLTKKRRSR